VSYSENSGDSTATGLVESECDQARAESLAAIFGIHRDGADFSEIGAVTFQREAADDTMTIFLDDEMADMGANFFRGARKEQALRGVMCDKRVNRSDVGNLRAARSHGFSSSLARRALKS
jgi:hypothetical protein